uniref:PTS transporter subunit EIIC n=1 Tax=Clostridium sp. NkU-1 TaxID=1095009 RepID=UPI000AB9F3B1
MNKNKESGVFAVVQKIGRSFFLPVSILPIAGLLLGLGASFTNAKTIEAYHLQALLGEGTILNGLLIIMSQVGSTIFGNLPLIFAMAVALGMAKNEKAVAVLSSGISFFCNALYNQCNVKTDRPDPVRWKLGGRGFRWSHC